MKTNFNLDLALFFTSLSIILYSCGYFYIQAYVNYFDFTHEALGFDFQNYLIYGGLQGSQVIFLGILIPITLSLVNKFINQNISKSITKIFNYILIFIIIISVKTIVAILGLFYFPVRIISNFIYKFHKLANCLEILTFLVLFIAFLPLIFIIYLLKIIKDKIKPSILDTHKIAKDEIHWNSSIDTPNIDKGLKELLLHYIGSVIIYALFFIGIYYLIDIEKNGSTNAKKDLLFSPITNLTIKDEKITEWYKLNKIKEPITKNIKILICGKSKCLVAVEVQPKLMFTNQNLPVIKSNLLTTINNDNYSTF